MWDANSNTDSLLDVEAAAHPPRAVTSMRPEHMSEIYGISTGPCGGVSLKVNADAHPEHEDM